MKAASALAGHSAERRRTRRIWYVDRWARRAEHHAVDRGHRSHPLPKALDADPEKTLLKVSVAFLEGLYQPRQVAWHRAVVADSRVHPDAGRMVFEGPVMRSESVFDHYFRKQVQRGLMQFPNIELAAAQFLGILKTNLHLRLTLSEPEVISHRQIEDIARASVHLFLYGAIKRSRTKK